MRLLYQYTLSLWRSCPTPLTTLSKHGRTGCPERGMQVPARAFVGQSKKHEKSFRFPAEPIPWKQNQEACQLRYVFEHAMDGSDLRCYILWPTRTAEQSFWCIDAWKDDWARLNKCACVPRYILYTCPNLM